MSTHVSDPATAHPRTEPHPVGAERPPRYAPTDLVAVGGSLWEKHGRSRVYFNRLAELYGLDVSFYRTGNVSAATLDDHLISNSEARRILARLAAARFWYDNQEGRFDGWPLKQHDREWLVRAVERRVVERRSHRSPTGAAGHG